MVLKEHMFKRYASYLAICCLEGLAQSLNLQRFTHNCKNHASLMEQFIRVEHMWIS